MKQLLILLALFLSVIVSAQDIERLTPADIVTGSNSGDAEIKAAFRRFNVSDTLLRLWINNAKRVFNWQDSSIIIINSVYFNLEQGDDLEEGVMAWDSTDKTLSVGLDAGSSGQMFQETHMRATNKTAETILDGDIVYVKGAQGNRPTIDLVSDTSITAILTLGVATQDIASNRTGYVTLLGLVRGYDTRDIGAGNVMWAATERGKATNVRPPAGRTAVTLGIALNETEDGLIAVRPVVVQRLSWLSDVDARGNEKDWDMLYWNADSLTWETTDGFIDADSFDVAKIINVPTYADNATAIIGGLSAGDLYRTATGELMIVY